MDSKAIGRKVEALREKLGMTTTELAKKVKISQAQISRLESGKQGFRANTLIRIAEALGVKPVYFFMEEEDEQGEVREGSPIYGLLAGGELLKALRSPEFVRVAEDMAEAFLHNKEAFEAIQLAVKAITGSGKKK